MSAEIIEILVWAGLAAMLVEAVLSVLKKALGLQ